MTKTFQIKTQQEMAALAKDLAKNLNTMFKFQKVICLSGTLGAGKTFFAKEFIGALLKEKQEITSPTFNLLNIYDSIQGEIFHFDLYRLKDENELENIGFFDAIKDNICLIEWPNIAKKYLKHYIEIEIAVNNSEEREVKLTNV
ncbi:MAG: tRNA (adenosine(37)-N6)-threonylcarbamoyltransferase complex ATPase subunit type 1 TsaE [Rickettsiales bacterium]|nr:tRNA (adenosine(37)-N6)-threonylcarbamoyltransferase complex ATPase subunit type 1 TsaE [Rickettsiales bacterium]